MPIMLLPVALGALGGAVVMGGITAFTQWRAGQPLDWSAIGRSAAEGALWGGIGGLGFAALVSRAAPVAARVVGGGIVTAAPFAAPVPDSAGRRAPPTRRAPPARPASPAPDPRAEELRRAADVMGEISAAIREGRDPSFDADITAAIPGVSPPEVRTAITRPIDRSTTDAELMNEAASVLEGLTAEMAAAGAAPPAPTEGIVGALGATQQ